jgi:hypothetical protein
MSIANPNHLTVIYANEGPYAIGIFIAPPLSLSNSTAKSIVSAQLKDMRLS